MPFVRTILGDILPDALGVCYSHEHLIIDPSFTGYYDSDFLLDDVGLAGIDLTLFQEAGGRALVDAMPCAAGRNAAKLAALATRHGLHILCPTGLHLPKYYPPGHWGEKLCVDELTRLFVADIEIGIDRYDYRAPIVARLAHRAGLIKIATGQPNLDDRERRIFEAAAAAHRATGAPILTHAEQGRGALEQLRFLGELGVSPRHVVISHTDRFPDLPYHLEVLSTGAFLEYDSAFRWRPEEENATLKLIMQLARRDQLEGLLLGMDARIQQTTAR
jgi:predicted metal-dependent phosphotriesterase family hydrolase